MCCSECSGCLRAVQDVRATLTISVSCFDVTVGPPGRRTFGHVPSTLGPLVVCYTSVQCIKSRAQLWIWCTVHCFSEQGHSCNVGSSLAPHVRRSGSQHCHNLEHTTLVPP